LTRCPPRLKQSRAEQSREEQSNQPASQPASPPASTYYPFHGPPSRRVCQPLTYGPHGFLLLFASGRRKLLLSSPLLYSPLSFPLPSFLFLSPPPPGGRWVNWGLEHGTPTLGIGDFDGGTSRTRTSTSWRSKNKERERDQQRLPAVICQRGLLSSSVNKRYEANHASLFFPPLCSPLARHHPSSGRASCAARFSLFIRPSAFAAALSSALSSPRGGG
jgi:hypothetical protein